MDIMKSYIETKINEENMLIERQLEDALTSGAFLHDLSIVIEYGADLKVTQRIW